MADEAAMPEAKLERFLQWLQANGAQLRGCSIKSCGPSKGFGVFASSAAGSAPDGNGVLMVVPLDLAITPMRVLQDPSLGFRCAEMFKEGDVDDRLLMMLFLTVERLRRNSPWKPYIDMLPSTFSNPLWFTDDELSELKDTTLYRATLLQKKKLQALFDDKVRALVEEILHLDGEVESGSNVQFEDFLWANSIFWTRALNIPFPHSYVFPSPVGEENSSRCDTITHAQGSSEISAHDKVGRAEATLEVAAKDECVEESSSVKGDTVWVEGLIPGIDFCNHGLEVSTTWEVDKTGGITGVSFSMYLISGHFFNFQYIYRTDDRTESFDNASEVLIGTKNVIKRMLTKNVIKRMLPDDDRAIIACKQIHDYRLRQHHFGTRVVQRATQILSPADWWLDYGRDHGYEDLAYVAILILSQTISAIGCERNWSTFGLIHTKQRNRLKSKRLEKLVFCHYNMMFKLKNLQLPKELQAKENNRASGQGGGDAPASDTIDPEELFEEDHPLHAWVDATTSGATEFDDNDQTWAQAEPNMLNAEKEICISYGNKGNEELLYLYGFVMENNPDDYLMVHYPIEALQNVPFADSKAHLLEIQKAEFRCLLPKSLLDHGLFSGKLIEDVDRKNRPLDQHCGYSWSGQRKVPPYLNKLVFPEDFLSALRTISLQEHELTQVSSLVEELVGSEEQRLPSGRDVQAAVWEAAGDSGALQLLVDLLQTRLMELEEGSGTEACDTQLLEKFHLVVNCEESERSDTMKDLQKRMNRNRWSSIIYRQGQKQLTRLFLKEAEHALELISNDLP